MQLCFITLVDVQLIKKEEGNESLAKLKNWNRQWIRLFSTLNGVKA